MELKVGLIGIKKLGEMEWKIRWFMKIGIENGEGWNLK